MDSTSTFRLFTLVDITMTGATRDIPGNELVRNQQRNWETVLQVLSLRAQPYVITPPRLLVSHESSAAFFGSLYETPYHFWACRFQTEYPEAYGDAENPVKFLLEDFEQVPIITGLTEEARFLLPIFYPHGPIKNIHINYFH